MTMHDSWKTSSGLPEDIDITITDVRWEFGEAIRNDDGSMGEERCRTVFVYEDEDGEEGEMFLGTGKGWEPGPKGNSVVREDGKKAKFNNRSAFGFWLNAASDLDGVSEAIGKLDTTKKETWIGTKWHIQRHIEKWNRGGRSGETNYAYPDAYLGRVGDKSKGAKATAGNGKASTKETSEEEVDISGPSGKLLTKLTKLAGEHDNHEDWAAAALEDEAVSGNQAFTEWVMDEDNYTSLVSSD